MPIKTKVVLKKEASKAEKHISYQDSWRLTNNLIKKAQDDYKQKWFNPKIREESLIQIAKELKKQGYKDTDIGDLKEIYDTASRVAVYSYPDKSRIAHPIKDVQPFKINNYHFFITKDSAVLGMHGYLIAKGDNTEEAKQLAIRYVDDHKSYWRKNGRPNLA